MISVYDDGRFMFMFLVLLARLKTSLVFGGRTNELEENRIRKTRDKT